MNDKLDPTSDLPDDTSIDRVRFPTRIVNVCKAAGLTTIREMRETRDTTFLRFVDFGPGSLTYIRNALGPAR